jgi:phosphoribosyl 1,2-cyclic phosphodiesterase
MNVTLWGTRGSVPSAGAEYVRYGGNTSCVEVRTQDGWVVVLDAGTGVRALGEEVGPETTRVDLLLTHLHMDHIQGLGFFAPLFKPDLEVHIWGPASTTRDMRERLARYLSPPLFPVLLRDLPCKLTLHNAPIGRFEIGPLTVHAGLICHPGPTLGYRLEEGGRALAYMPDHEPALGLRSFEPDRQWTSGFRLAEGADVLIHDAQYTSEEYEEKVGWGHSAYSHTMLLAEAASVGKLVTFHHDPSHTDADLDAFHAGAQNECRGLNTTLVAGKEGLRLAL